MGDELKVFSRSAFVKLSIVPICDFAGSNALFEATSAGFSALLLAAVILLEKTRLCECDPFMSAASVDPNSMFLLATAATTTCVAGEV
jgi:hypothetical protein